MSTNSPAREKKDDDRVSGEVALVQCNGYRCMAFRDRQGKWRNYFRGDELQGVVRIIELFS